MAMRGLTGWTLAGMLGALAVAVTGCSDESADPLPTGGGGQTTSTAGAGGTPAGGGGSGGVAGSGAAGGAGGAGGSVDYDELFASGFELDTEITSDLRNITGTDNSTGYSWDDLPTLIESVQQHRPKDFILQQNYPNPFNPSTTIEYTLPRTTFVTLKVYDLLGREVQTLVHEKQSAGAHSVVFEAKELPSTIYFYKLQSENFCEIRKMLLVR